MRYIFFIFLFLSFHLHAVEPSDVYSKLNSKLTNPSLLAVAITAGEDRATVCKYCHGTDGNSTRNYIPNLAQQNNKYLLKQFELFASKQRNNKVMSELAKNLTDDDRVNISLFYSSQKVKPRPTWQPELLPQGKQIFLAQCAGCHGNDGHGKEELPRVAGQPSEYLKITLDLYRTDPGRRANSPMQAIAGALTASNQAAVIEFISTLK